MARLIAGRLVALVAVLWALVTIVFVIQTVIPSDPARLMAGQSAPPEVVAAKRAQLHLDEPLPQQYVRFIGNALQGDLSISVHTHRPVVDDLGRAIPATLELLLAALVITIVLGTLAGLAAARGTRLGTPVRLVMAAGASVPSFLVGLLALLLLYNRLGWIPGAGRLSADVAAPGGPTGLLTVDGLLTLRPRVTADALWHLLAPAFCIAIAPALVLARTLRSTLVTQREAGYVRTARAKALTERQILLRHMLRNALNAPLSILGLEVGVMLAGIVVVEAVFSWPGLGLYTSQAITTNDFPAIAGVTLCIGAVYVIANAVVDVLQLLVDPRLRSRSA
ncbi:ABC transporter permease [Conexibacter stalactiti]|uniref:ABC transporter permease n=1 Tax=Conexibacter stalactiti TaxID=1940611 RepID=A0ABU4HRZ6_9ACTN|nr:ABC transporter permease [Conexibacter stalactiti]MDW5594829.1 ABC transporter permease [Conexibacter stalactiti]MEC5035471.1 ABC transporter permease [Conexibacter stalactiti]